MSHEDDADVPARRRNADSADDGSPAGRVYRRLLHLQIDLQVADDEPAEDALLDILDAAHRAGLLPAGRAPAAATTSPAEAAPTQADDMQAADLTTQLRAAVTLAAKKDREWTDADAELLAGLQALLGPDRP